jgi:hypothetical protein
MRFPICGFVRTVCIDGFIVVYDAFEFKKRARVLANEEVGHSSHHTRRFCTKSRRRAGTD